MSKSNEENLRAFYEKLLEIKNKEAEKSLSQQELKEIAMELGFSENEWHLVEEKVEGHLKNGQSFLTYQNWDDAIAQFEQALQLSPNNPAATYGLAIAYHSLYLQNRRSKDKEKALAYARIRLVNEPGHEPSIKIISELQKGVQARNVAPSSTVAKPVTTPTANKGSVSSLVRGALVATFVAGIIGYMSVARSSKSDSYTEKDYKPSVTQKSSSTSPNESRPTRSLAPSRRNYTNVPVKFVESSWGQDFKLVQVEKSEARSSSRMFSYKLSGSLQITGERPIEELKLKAEFITNSGKVGIAEYISVVRKYQPNAIKGDYAPFYLSKYNKKYTGDSFKEVRISVHTLKHATNKRYTSRPVPVVWAYDQPRGINVEVIERAQKVRNYRTSTSHQVELSFVNKGKQALQRLKVEAQWLNQQGEIVHSVTRTLVYPHQADFFPNHNRLQRFHAYIKDLSPRGIKGYRINIIEADTK
jgi:hypothetical protein